MSSDHSLSQADCAYRPVVGFEHTAKVSRSGEIIRLAYSVTSSDGRLRHFPEKRLIPQRCGLYATITQDRITWRVNIARAVASAWIRQPHRSEWVVHRDGDVSNNGVDNLLILPVRKALAYVTKRGRRAGNLQYKAEIWRAVPECDVLQVSNFRRFRSSVVLPPSLRSAYRRKDGVLTLSFRTSDGVRKTRTIAQIFREAFPELAHEVRSRRKAVKSGGNAGSKTRQESGRKRAKNGVRIDQKTA